MICSRCRQTYENSQYKHCDKCREYNKKYRDSIPRLYKQGSNSTNDGITKTCSDCKNRLPLTNFYKHRRYKDGYRNQCIECHNIRFKTYYQNGYNQELQTKLQIDPVYKLKQNLKSYLHVQLKNQSLVKTKPTMKYIGCSKEFLINWLKFQNKNWHLSIYHIDHIIPLDTFDLNNPNEQEIAFHWTNLQPLLRSENLTKKNKIRIYEICNNFIYMTKFNLSQNDLEVIRKRKQWFTNYLQHIQTAGNP